MTKIIYLHKISQKMFLVIDENIRLSIYYIFVQVQRLTFVGVNFLVMFTDFGHIRSVLFIQSSWFGHANIPLLLKF